MGRFLRALLPAGCLLGCSVAATPAAGNVDWPEYLGGPERAHASPLTQITPANVARLEVAWTFHTGDFGEMQCNPLVVDGVLYAVTAANTVVALDGASGRELWRHRVTDTPAGHVLRGVTFWRDGGDRRILFTFQAALIALNADTGARITGFGEGGAVSLRAGLGEAAQSKWVVSTTPGALFGDVLVVPTRVTEAADAAPGFIQAFNVRTGAPVWTFHTIPRPGEPGYETWPRDAHTNERVGGANSWAGMAVDRERGLVFVPTGSASPDFWGGDRKGENRFANCLLALDARTGALRWHFQFVHHDLWDRDPPAPPNLVTLHRDGRRLDAVAQVTKSGHVFVFDRESGEPLFPIEEVPVPPSEIPGEESWPTQPVPTRPAPFARQTLAADEVNPHAPDREHLLVRLRQARQGAFQPFGEHETLLFPGFDGGAEWGGAAVDAEGVLYVNANEMAWAARLRRPAAAETPGLPSPGRRVYANHCVACHGPERKGDAASGFPSLEALARRSVRAEVAQLIAAGRNRMPGFALPDADRQALLDFLFDAEKVEGAPASALPSRGGARPPGTAPYELAGYNKFVDADGYPAIRPPWGTLTAIDLNTGEHRWRLTLGEFPELTARGIPPTGTENYGGPIITASGVLFIAATKDGRFRAFDSREGRLLWQTELPAPGFATPATYAIDGRQYVVIAAGGTKLGTRRGDSFVAFALPSETKPNP